MADVQDNATAKRFELMLDGYLAWSSYVRSGRVVDIQHTLVPPEARGKGMASILIQGSLDLIRARGEKVIPTCPFVYAYMSKHKETQDLLTEPGWLEQHPLQRTP